MSLVLRALAEPADDGASRDVALWASALLLLASGGVFAAVIAGTNFGHGATASATGVFFVLGAVGYLASAILNLLQVSETVRDSLSAAPSSKQVALVYIQQYGFALMFIGGVTCRAVPTLSGHKRRDRVAVGAALLLAAGVATFSIGALWSAYRAGSETTARCEDLGLILTAAAFVLIVYASAALEPGPNRVAAASQTQFWFVRTAMAWLLVAAALTCWYAVPALADGGFVDQFELDAMRHTTTIGLLTMLIVGMALLIVPEFAGRRLQHPDERWLLIAMLIALNAAVVLRIWLAAHGIDWLSNTRFWPMAAAGALAEVVVAAFGFMFVQSYVEQRHPGWASPAAIRARKGQGSPRDA